MYWGINLRASSDWESSRYSSNATGVVVYVAPLGLAIRYAYSYVPCLNACRVVINGWLPLAVYDNTSSVAPEVTYDPSDASCSVLTNVAGRQDPTFDACHGSFISTVVYSPWTWQFLMATGMVLMTASMWFAFRTMHRMRFGSG